MHFSMRRMFLPAVLLAGWFLMSVLPGAAQTRVIKGKVTDDKDQPIAGAVVTIQGKDVNRNYTVKTDKKGQYTYLLGSQTGSYVVYVHAKGYEPRFQDNVRPPLGEETVVDFQLPPGTDTKLPFEMTEAERAEYTKKLEEQQKRSQLSSEIKSTFKLAVQLSDEGKYEESIAEFNKALEKLPDEPAIYAGLANDYSKLGKNDEALAAYQKAISLKPNDPALYTNMGVLLNSMGKLSESQAAFKKASELDPSSAAQNFYNIGVTLVNGGKSAEAAEAFKQSIAADPNYAEAYYQLGMALSGKQDTIPAAIEALKKYIQIGKKPDQIEVAKQIISALGGK
jgi:tetratricopeptide (TPR) repeat protein